MTNIKIMIKKLKKIILFFILSNNMIDKDSKKIKSEIDLAGKKSTNKKQEFNIDEILTKILSSRK